MPILLTVAALTLIVGTDHPNGKWEDRFQPLPAATPICESVDPEGLSPVANDIGAEACSSSAKDASSSVQPEKTDKCTDEGKGAHASVTISPADLAPSELDVAVNKPLTMVGLKNMATSPLTWLPSLAYLTTFGFELAMDANLANILYDMYQDRNLGQTRAGYIAAIYGLLNVFSRALGMCHPL